MLEFQDVTRKKRPMQAVQVGVDNAQEIADWCKGEVVNSTVRIMGTQTSLPAVKLNRPSTGGRDYTTALVTMWVVEFPNEFRIFKDEQYQQLFEKVDFKPKRQVIGTLDNPIVLVSGDAVSHNLGYDIVLPSGVITQLGFSGEGTPPVLVHHTQDPNAQMLGLMSYSAARNAFADVLKEGVERSKAVEKFHEIRQIEEARLYNVGPIREEQSVHPRQGRISMEDVTDPFHEPPNPTPAGESLGFRAGQKVEVIDKEVDAHWVDREGTVTAVGVLYAKVPHGIEVEFDEGLGTVMNPKMVFHPTQLKHK